MNELGDRNSYLISHALKSCGYNKEDVKAYVMEDLYMDEASEILSFIDWICDNDVSCTEELLPFQFRWFQNDNDNSGNTLRYRNDGGTEGG